MKRFCLFLFIMLSIISGYIYGKSEILLLFQGEIVNQSRQPLDVPDVYNVSFSIWDSITSGNQLWSQQIGSVTIQKGVLSVLLGGNAAPFPTNLFSSSERYLQITITKDGNSETLAPRMRITASSYMIAGTESSSCPGGMVRVTNFCIDFKRRGPVSEFNAMKMCYNRNMSLCQWTQVMHACELKLLDVNKGTPLSIEWIAVPSLYMAKFVWGIADTSLPECYRLDAPSVIWSGADRMYYYRCCK